MTAARIVLAVAVVSTGLFTGLVLYILGMFQPLLTQLTGPSSPWSWTGSCPRPARTSSTTCSP
jgi:hypothetical protein